MTKSKNDSNAYMLNIKNLPGNIVIIRKKKIFGVSTGQTVILPVE